MIFGGLDEDRLKHAIIIGFEVLEADLVVAFAHAFFVAAKVRRGSDPNHAIERYVLIVDTTKNRHVFVVLRRTIFLIRRSGAWRPLRLRSPRRETLPLPLL